MEIEASGCATQHISYQGFNTLDCVNEVFQFLGVERLNALHDNLAKQGTTLYFIPTLRFENTPLPNLFKRLRQGDLYIETSNPLRYPDFYSPEFSGDAAHLNLQGARLYSRTLGELFLSINAAP